MVRDGYEHGLSQTIKLRTRLNKSNCLCSEHRHHIGPPSLLPAANLSMKAEIEDLKQEIHDFTNVAKSQKAELDEKLAQKAELEAVSL